MAFNVFKILACAGVAARVAYTATYKAHVAASVTPYVARAAAYNSANTAYDSDSVAFAPVYARMAKKLIEIIKDTK